MAEKCVYIKDDGERCGAWSLKDGVFCRIHKKMGVADLVEKIDALESENQGGRVADTLEALSAPLVDYDNFLSCDGLCCDEGRIHLHNRGDKWIFVLKRQFSNRAGVVVKYCPWCSKELEV